MKNFYNSQFRYWNGETYSIESGSSVSKQVTNFEYEQQMNEKNRIFVLKDRFLSAFVDDFKVKMSTKNRLHTLIVPKNSIFDATFLTKNWGKNFPPIMESVIQFSLSVSTAASALLQSPQEEEHNLVRLPYPVG